MALSKLKRQEKAEAVVRLRELCPPGTIIYTSLRRVSKSGMGRVIACFLCREGGIGDISWRVAQALRCQFKQTDCGAGVYIGGCGMDMGFHIVHSLSYVLHGHEDHGIVDGSVHDAMHPSPTDWRAGYSLIHRWI